MNTYLDKFFFLFSGLLISLSSLIEVTGTSLLIALYLLILSMTINKISKIEVIFGGLICICVISLNTNLSNLVFLFTILRLSLHLNEFQLREFLNGIFLGYFILTALGFGLLLAGSSRDEILGLSSVVVGRYLLYSVFIFYILYWQSKFASSLFLLIVSFFLESKTIFGLALINIILNFQIIPKIPFPAISSIFFGSLIFVVTIWLPLVSTYLGSLSILSSMTNRIVVFQDAISLYLKDFSIFDILIGSSYAIDSHFGPVDVLFNYGLPMSIFLFYILSNIFKFFRQLQDYYLFLLVFSIFLASFNSGGVWSLRESFSVLIISAFFLSRKNVRLQWNA